MDQNSNPSNKMLWEMSEKVHAQKKELDKKLEEIEVEKESIQIQKEEVEEKVKNLWKQSEDLHEEKERINVIKEKIEHKHKDLTDSILYAERLQLAILPTFDYIAQLKYETLIYFNPKDIVSGDFYWVNENDDFYFIAAADCTGHGVPGAIVSVVCSTALNRSVNEFNLSNPGEILDQTSTLVTETFSKADYEVRDGMDISLSAISKKDNFLYWAGANNPLWTIRNNATEIEEIKPNKQPIGYHENSQPFKNHKVTFDQGDQIFMFSDGYQDQFGGPSGKKYKAKNMKNFFLDIQNLDMDEKKAKINQNFVDWKGDIDQIDDVCIVNVKF